MHNVTARSGFVTEAELPMAALQPLDEPTQRLRGARDLAQKTHFAAAARLGGRHRRHSLVHIQPDERGSFHAARLLCLRLGAGQSGATLDHDIPETRPSAQGANIGSKTWLTTAGYQEGRMWTTRDKRRPIS